MAEQPANVEKIVNASSGSHEPSSCNRSTRADADVTRKHKQQVANVVVFGVPAAWPVMRCRFFMAVVVAIVD